VKSTERDDDSPERARQARMRAQAHQHELAHLAGEIAHTEDEVARVHEQIAAGTSSMAGQAKEHASAARAFAMHEREEQQRWSAPDEHPADGEPEGVLRQRQRPSDTAAEQPNSAPPG
jgi:hypothetical protein